MKKMILIAEEFGRVIDPSYDNIKISPQVAKIINSIRKDKEKQK
jgi:hypothetical protein